MQNLRGRLTAILFANGRLTRSSKTSLVIVALFVIILNLYYKAVTRKVEREFVPITEHIDAAVATWVNTFHDVKAGDIIEGEGELRANRLEEPVTPDGHLILRYWNINPNSPPLPERDSDDYFRRVGDPLYQEEEMFRHTVPALPYGALVGRIGEGDDAVFLVGRKARAPKDGRLYLAINHFYWTRRYNTFVSGILVKHTNENQPAPQIMETGGFGYRVRPARPDEADFKVTFVSAARGWQPTGFHGGDHVQAFGWANSKDGLENSDLYENVGVWGWYYRLPELITLSRRLVPNCQFMSLVGQSAVGQTFCVSEDMVLPGAGDVQMAVNDIYWDKWGNEMPSWRTENEGGFTVRTFLPAKVRP